MGSLKDLGLGPSPKNPGEGRDELNKHPFSLGWVLCSIGSMKKCAHWTSRLWANPPGCGSPGRPGHLWLAVKVLYNLELVEAAHTALQWLHAEGTLPLFKSNLPQAFKLLASSRHNFCFNLAGFLTSSLSLSLSLINK